MIGALLRRFWPHLAALAGVSVAALAIAGWINAYGERRELEGRAAVQDLWDEYTLEQERLNLTREEAARVHNEEVKREYEKQVADAMAGRSDYERLLRQARNQISALRAAQAASASGTAAPAAERREAGIDEVLAWRLSECDANDAQLAALIDVVKAQM